MAPLPLLEIDAPAWTLQISTREHHKESKFVNWSVVLIGLIVNLAVGLPRYRMH
jgi:hypothetical protein